MGTDSTDWTGKAESVELPREKAFAGHRVRRKVASALLLGCALPLLVLAYALHILSGPVLDPHWWLLGGVTIPALLVFTALLMSGGAVVVWDLSSAVSRLAGLAASGRITSGAATDRTDEIGNLLTSFARMAATIEQQAAQIKLLPGRLSDLTRQAFQDSLTKLPNRALFLDRLTHGLVRAQRRRQAVALLFADLDRFKLINDGLGHSAGDRLLVEVGQRLQRYVRDEDTLARLGGDEFGILLEEVTDLTAATEIAQRIDAGLREPFVLAGREIVITASIGIAMSDGDVPPDDLVRQADLAMYRAKAGGRARYAVFQGTMETPAQERLDTEMALRRAVERRELTLHYQPIVSLDTGEVVDVEALLRWDRCPAGRLLPAEIVQVLEDTNLIVPVGEWVLQEACRQAAQWQAGGMVAPLVSVNVSAGQLHASSLVDSVATALRNAGLNPDRLKLELTEATAMMADPRSLAELHKLKEMGVHLLIDDFGTGHSSLTRLKHFPVDGLKIDGSVVRGLPRDPADVAIVHALAGVACALNLTLTAEGVESHEQVVQLKALGCSQAQGYYFAPPLLPDRLRRFFFMRSKVSGDQDRKSGGPVGSGARGEHDSSMMSKVNVKALIDPTGGDPRESL